MFVKNKKVLKLIYKKALKNNLESFFLFKSNLKNKVSVAQSHPLTYLMSLTTTQTTNLMKITGRIIPSNIVVMVWISMRPLFSHWLRLILPTPSVSILSVKEP